MLRAEMVIPLRWDAGHLEAEIEEMGAYLRFLGSLLDVTVVDGSSEDVRSGHVAAWGRSARIIRPHTGPGANGKVLGAVSGIGSARHDLVVLADDDVRYDADSLRAVVAALGRADVVRPQNTFVSWPWHARWDGGRSLLCRAFAADWPGTFGLRTEAVQQMDGWDADVLFENLEMVRTAEVHGLRVLNAPEIVVLRLPPSARHFWSQRVRQAYDSLAQPGRLLAELSVLPLLLLAAVKNPLSLPVAALVVVALAEVGRRRFSPLTIPRDVPLWAPLWLIERGVCSFLAVGSCARGGVVYRGRRLRLAAHSKRKLAQNCR